MSTNKIFHENKEVWMRLMDKGWKKDGIENYGEQDVANRLSLSDIDFIKYTWKFARVNIALLRLVVEDLWHFRYRVFDWLGMLNTGRNLGFKGETQTERVRAVKVTKVLSDIYLLPTFRDVRHLGTYLERANFLEELLQQDLKCQVAPRDERYLTLHFPEYQLYNRWGGPDEEMYVTIPPQDWVISKQGHLY